MAQTKEDLLIKIQADTANASESIALLAKQLGRLEMSMVDVSKSSKQTSQTVSGFGAAMIAVSAGIAVAREAFTQISGTITATIGAFQDSEDGLIRLGNTMRVVGDSDIQKSIDAFKELAQTMQETTTVEDDQVIKLANIAKATGLSTDKTMELIRASADLAATGKSDLNGSFNALLKSLKGSTMGLSVMLPELTNMSKESAKAGDAISFVRDTLGGLSEKELLTTSGQLLQAKNRFNDLEEGVGEVAAAFLGLKAGTSSYNAILGGLVESFNRNKVSILEFAKSVHDGFSEFVAGIKSLYAGLNAVDWARVRDSIALVGVAVAGVILILSPAAVAAFATSIANMGVAALLATPKIILMGIALAKSAISMAIISAKFILVAAGVATVVVAVDFLVANLKQLPVIAEMGFQALQIAALSAREAIVRAMGNDVEADKLLVQIGAIGTKFQENQKLLKGGLVSDGIKELAKFKDEFLKTFNAITGEKPAPKDDKGKGKGRSVGPVLLSPEEKAAMDLRVKNYNDLKAQNAALDLENRRSQMTTIDYLSQKHKIEVETLRSKFKAGELDTLGTAELEKQIELMGLKNDAAKQQAPSKRFEHGQQAGEAAVSNLGSAISAAAGPTVQAMGGAMQSAVGAMSGVASGLAGTANVYMAAVESLLGVVQGIIDFIPKILDSIAGIFNSAAELPSKIIGSLKGVIAGIVKFTSDFIPGIFQMIPDIYETIIDGALNKIPEASMKFFAGVPDMIMNFFNRFPAIIEMLVTRLISSSIEMSIAIVTSIIGNIPRIVVAIIKALVMAVRGIWIGIIKGIQQIFAAFGNMFSKKKIKIDVDPKSLTESMKKAAQTLTGEASKLFKVVDLGANTEAADKSKEQIKAVEEAGKRAQDWLSEAWHKILSGFGELMTWFSEVWKQLLRSLTEVWNGIVRMLTDVFTAVKDIFNGIIAAFEGVFSTLSDIGNVIAKGVTDGLQGAGDFFYTLGDQIWQGLWSGIKGLGSFFTNMLNSINPSNLFEKMFRVPASPQGTVETALGINVPFMNFAKGGMVPGNAMVAGDSLMNDRVLAMISPGEAVVPRSKMNDPFLSGLVRGVLDGTITPPKFAGGYFGQVAEHAAGVVKTEAEKARDFLMSLSPTQMWDMVKDRVLKEMIPNMLAANKFHEGGIIGGSGDVPILGQAGEFVMQRSAVSGIGQGNLAQMNKTGSSSLQGNTSNVYNIDIKVDAKTAPDEKFIRGTLLPILKEELRRASLDGQRVLFQSGVRA